MNNKRIIAFLMICTMVLTLFVGCKSDNEEWKALDTYIENEKAETGDEPFEELQDPVQEEQEKEPQEKEEPEKEEPKDETPAPQDQEEEKTNIDQEEPEQELSENITPEPEKEPEDEQTKTESGGPLFTENENPYKESLKILAIGNSFSIDGMEYLWDIANSYGVKEIVLGNLYIGGCSLDKHYKNMTQDAPAYRYYKNTAGSWSSTADVAISTALKDEKWDIITVQQASGENVNDGSYDNLPNILKYIEQRKPKKETKILWHMTWAYQSDSTQKAFEAYGRDQNKMYEGILERVQSNVLNEESIVGVIPAGTAIQNLRKTSVGDTLTRDGYHLSKGLGRYTAALTWYCYITGADPAETLYTPFEEQAKILRHHDEVCKAIRDAIQKPYGLT